MTRWLSRILFFFGLFIAAYVLYAHVSSWRMAVRAPSDWSTHLQTASIEKDGFTVDRHGLDGAMADEVFVVSGKTTSKGMFRLHRPAKRFDGGMMSARFRVGELAEYDVLVGFQLAGDPQRRVALTFSNDTKKPRLRLLGAASPIGPLPASDGVLDDLESLSQVTEALHPNEWHELAIRFDAPNQQFEFFVDMVPVAARRLGWMAGVDVEPFVGVEERTPGSDPHVGFDVVSFVTGPSGPPFRGTRFIDEFPGSLPDPLRWQTTVVNDWRMKGGIVRESTGNGLHLEGGAAGVTAVGIETPVKLCRYPTELDPVHIETRWDIRKLRYAMIYVSISNSTDSRVLEAAVRGLDEGQPRQWLFTGQSGSSIEPGRTEGPAVVAEGNELAFEMSYDPWLRRATIRSGGNVVHQKRYDLSRKEHVQICVGAHVSAGGEFDATLKRINVRFAPY
ncbi:hypothetical protein [Pendulispora albinea]|uniref:Uncharacterized protein n=1 Tax=Pendulispora albinea TaxID=2741071 RepID=A0ABZ2LKJ7_9BACT